MASEGIVAMGVTQSEVHLEALPGMVYTTYRVTGSRPHLSALRTGRQGLMGGLQMGASPRPI